MTLHPLTEADLELILPWRNTPAVRRAMVSQHEISLDEHCTWFQRLRQDPSRRWYLYQDDSGTAQGVVYFTDLDPAQGTAFWGFYARPEAPAGTGLQILFAALDTAFGELALHKLSGEVLAQAEATHELCRWFVDTYPTSAEQGQAQAGEETFYPRRRLLDSRLDAELSLAEQFDLLRVVDNARYPAFVEWRERRYALAISEAGAK
ncbi:MAG: UDP-4-amino-4,6-dideoxy-N-acetyl-beta-L-altrosamine N-acetyltransferase [Lamprobacter sp.]|uniref:UDP-4-amino-4, 6-dideoxy-N-acetyl-beta-L-altrosamine N-acetyltransferase n=1 Tax=Lamprobacter sp. TaxID=3100796 RepID=UPI002B259158|nr:UDP-4-amino-4,6-dideoxy-N-acetyl-beta-L-altrosamine N-acetyltransferase [Lamprobacter sp.]MEA3641705.1 UDP-4-amino-4,6-dideoxy-N-acetyl-beta-L-altrosamine N-acetyltransferase [Lamprobacter sp.]